jgi:predicted ATPase
MFCFVLVRGELSVARELAEHLLRLAQAYGQAGQHEEGLMEIAHWQQVKALELRAALSLARLWQQRGQRVEAHQWLADIYGWLTEGFDTADLQDARALLEELA